MKEKERIYDAAWAAVRDMPATTKARLSIHDLRGIISAVVKTVDDEAREMPTAEIDAVRVVDGTGRPHLAGSYIEILVQPKGAGKRRYRISHGMAECLRDELANLLVAPREDQDHD